MKTIKIYTGDALLGINGKLYEEMLHPIRQIEKVKKELESDFEGEKIIFTNSAYVTECFNKLGKAMGANVKMFYNGDDFNGEKDKVFEKFSKPFEELIKERIKIREEVQKERDKLWSDKFDKYACIKSDRWYLDWKEKIKK